MPESRDSYRHVTVAGLRHSSHFFTPSSRVPLLERSMICAGDLIQRRLWVASYVTTLLPKEDMGSDLRRIWGQICENVTLGKLGRYGARLRGESSRKPVTPAAASFAARKSLPFSVRPPRGVVIGWSSYSGRLPPTDERRALRG